MLPALIGALGEVAGTALMSAAEQAAAATASSRTAAAQQAAVAQGFQDKAATGLTKLTESLKPLSGAIGNVQSQFAQLTGMAGKVAGSVGLVTEPFKAVVGVMGQFRDSVTALGSQVSEFTRLANPALTQRFTMAAEDLTAVIGKMLLPVLEFATKFTRGFGDTLNQLAGPVGRLLSTGLKPLGDVIPTLTNTMGPLVRNVGMLLDNAAAVGKPLLTIAGTLYKIMALPVEALFSGFAAVLEALTAPLVAVAKLVGELATAFDKFVTRGIADLRRLLGLPTAAGSSVGAAVRGANISSVEAFQNKAITAAFGLGTASADERTASYADQILAWLKGPGLQQLKALPTEIAAVLATIIESLTPDLPSAGDVGRAADTASGVVDDVARWGVEAGRRLEDRAGRFFSNPLGVLD